MKKVLFRADAAPSIGIGDLVSLIYLSNYFSDDGWEIHFIIRGYEAGLKLAESHNLKQLTVIPPNLSVSNEVEIINNYCLSHQIDLLFLEITERPLTQYKNLLKSTKKACVCFDGKIPQDMDLVVDWDIAATDFFTPTEHPKTHFLLGPQYVILHQQYFSDKRITYRKHRNSIQHILIAMGGADENNFTSQLAQIILREKPDLQLTIVVGSGYIHRHQLEHDLTPFKPQYTIKHNITTMIEEYLSTDLAIGAGGLTASELVASRTSCLLLATYEHQIARCKYFAENGWATYLGFRNISKKNLIQSISKSSAIKQFPKFNTPKIIEVCNGLF